jgi:Putative Ig domain
MHVSKWTGWKVGCLMLVALMGAGCGGGGGGAATSNVTAPPTTGNGHPTISGQPASSIVAGQSYTFQPSASDPDGNALTFSATNVPAWASFNTSTGRLSGTPSAADVATYSGITISVSDGQLSASLNAFSISVVATGAGNGRATVSWTPPTQNLDGTTLTNLSGYEVYYGRSEQSLDQKVAVTNPSVTTYVVENLSSGTWYFTVVAVASTGALSPLSNLANKTI